MKFLVSLITISIAIFSFSKDIPFTLIRDNTTTNCVIDISGITFDENITISKAIVNNTEKIEAELVDQHGECATTRYDMKKCFRHLNMKVLSKGYTIKTIVFHMVPDHDHVDKSIAHAKEFILENKSDIISKAFGNIFDDIDYYITKNE